LIYFIIECNQFKFGLPDIRKGNFIYENKGRIGNYLMASYLKIPFLWELKLFVDWTFTYTAIDIF